MRKTLIAVLALGLALPALAHDAPGAAAQADEPAAPPERILVTGQRPGPGMWKVSSGEHVLWIFGTYSPLPKKMEWRSREVEDVVAASQEYLAPPVASASVGYLGGLAALPFMFGIKNLPDGKTLKDVLPADVYARWQPVKQQYFGDGDAIERERPVYAAADLYQRVLESAGLANGREVQARIESIVKKHEIRITQHRIEVDIKDAASKVREFKKTALDDTACFSRTLDTLEADVDAMRQRANAWAVGDIAAISSLDYGARQQACNAAFLSSPVLNKQPELQTMVERAKAAWLASAERALGANASTFAVLSMSEILDPKGLVATLRAKGYTVTAPR